MLVQKRPSKRHYFCGFCWTAPSMIFLCAGLRLKWIGIKMEFIYWRKYLLTTKTNSMAPVHRMCAHLFEYCCADFDLRFKKFPSSRPLCFLLLQFEVCSHFSGFFYNPFCMIVRTMGIHIQIAVNVRSQQRKQMVSRVFLFTHILVQFAWFILHTCAFIGICVSTIYKQISMLRFMRKKCLIWFESWPNFIWINCLTFFLTISFCAPAGYTCFDLWFV